MSYTPPTVVASGATFAQFQSGGASGHLELLIAAQAATLAPTVAHTLTPTGGGASGGLLAAGTYYSVVTEVNGMGETTKGPEAAQLTVGATNIPQATFATLKTGNVSRNLYLGAVNGLTGGPYFLYASGITAATYNLAVAVPANSYAMGPPAENTTGLAYTTASGSTQNATLQAIRAAKDGNLELVYLNLRQVIDEFNRGEPIPFGATLTKLRHAHAAFAMLATLCTEMGTLIDANPGTLGTVATGIGARKGKRTWP